MDDLRSATTKKTKVLIVDDDKFLQKILTLKFSASGFDVLVASDGEEAVRMIRENEPNLVILDLIMPKLNGFEVLTEIRTDPKTGTLPVVILSNLGQEEDKRRAGEMGIADFLVKSEISIQEVVQKVKEAYAKALDKAHQ